MLGFALRVELPPSSEAVVALMCIGLDDIFVVHNNMVHLMQASRQDSWIAGGALE